jgi:mRNA-degrading endonuclease RelE of RelBE toxin-antitoxin system
VNVRYRKSFLKDLKKLKGQPAYSRIFELVFTTLVEEPQLSSIPNIKAMKGYSNRYRIRLGDYRVGIEVDGDDVEVFRVLHRRDFYRYFP